MKVNGFLKDIKGAERVTEARRALIASGDEKRPYADPIRALARELHPAETHVVVTAVEDASPDARTFTFEAVPGETLPPFQAGQYCVLDVKVGPVRTSRPYSISSAPFQARAATTDGNPASGRPFFQVTIRNGRRGEGFAANWLYAYTKVGDQFCAHLPFGQFHFEPLRDTRKVVAIAGGSGITPFVSMAEEIAHGSLDIDLTIIYGSELPTSAILRGRLEHLAATCKHVHVVNVYSGSEEDVLVAGAPVGYEAGFISADIIRRHSPDDPASGEVTYFVCGPRAMYDYVERELRSLRVPARRIRMEVFGAPRDLSKAKGYPGARQTRYQLTVKRGLETDTIPISSTEPFAVAMDRARIPNNTRCRSGACGYCRCKLLAGEVFVPSEGDGRRFADKKFNYVHACSTYPLSDCTIEVPIV